VWTGGANGGGEAAPDTVTLYARGDLDMESVISFRDAAFTVIGGRPRELFLDLTAVPFADTTGLAALVTVARVARMVHIPVRVLPSPHLRRVLRVTGLTQLLPFAPGAAEEPDSPAAGAQTLRPDPNGNP
jgi:anti-anti-sigma factor